MMQFLRTKTKIFAWIFVVVLIGAFGLTSLTFNKHEQYAGEIFGKKISFQEFRTFETLTRILRPSDKIMEDPQLVYQFTWQQLALAREAQNLKISVTDEEVQQRVDLVINGNGSNRISRSEYLNLLKSWRTTPHEFENGIRELLRIQKMITQRFPTTPVSGEPTVDPAEIKKMSEKFEAEQNKMKEDYMKWISDLFQRAQIVDYSMAQKTLPQQETPV